MKKSKVLIGALCTFCVGLGAIVVGVKVQPTKAVEAQAVSYDSEDWTHYGSGSGSSFWQVNADNLKFLGGGGFTDQMLLTEQFDTAVANYTISADFVGTYNTTPIDKEMHAGIVPWYVDSNNWIIVYAQWWNPGGEDRLAVEMREVSIFAKIDGSEFVYFMSYEGGSWGWHNSTCWHDKWTNGNNLLPSNGFHLSVTKSRLMEAGVASDWIDLTISTIDQTTWSTSTYHGEWKFRDTANESNRYAKAKVGFYCENDEFTISNIAFGLDGYTTDSSAGFLTTDAKAFLDEVSASTVCGAIDSDAETKKASLEAAYGALDNDEKARLANVTYGGGKFNVLTAYDYYIGYANSKISAGSVAALISNQNTSSTGIIVLAVTVFAAIALCSFAVIKLKSKKE